MNDLLYRFADLVSRIITSAWFWYAFIALLVLMLATSVYRRIKLRTIEKIQYSRSFSVDGIFVDESLELIEMMSNPTWFPLFSIKMEFFLPSGLTVDGVTCNEYTKLTSVFNVPPFSTVRKVHTIKADKRSHYKLFTSCIKYRGFEFTYDSEIDFYAYPNQYDAGVSLPTDIFRAGEAISNRKYMDDPFFFSGIRAYRPGDPVRSINYKASVRSFSGGVRQFMCNEYDSSRNYDSMIFLDLTAYPEVELESVAQVELGLRYACYLFGLGIRNGGSVGFCTNCAVESSRYIHIPCGSGELHTKLILEQFAEISPYAKHDYSMTKILQTHAPQLSKTTDVYWITPFIDDKTAEALSWLQQKGRNVQVIHLSKGEQNETF